MVYIAKISLEDLKEHAKELLWFLDEKEIPDFARLEQIMRTSPVSGDEQGPHIWTGMRRSNMGTLTHTIDYILPGKGIPIDIKFNRPLGYTHFTIKFESRLDGYKPIIEGPFQNIVQCRAISGAELGYARTELQRIIGY
jgi:hypothetical protein